MPLTQALAAASAIASRSAAGLESRKLDGEKASVSILVKNSTRRLVSGSTPSTPADQLVQPVRGDQVGLLDHVEHRVVRPVRIGEALVALGGRARPRSAASPAARRGGGLPEIHVAAEEVGLGAHQPVGLGGEPAHHLGQRRARRGTGRRSSAAGRSAWRSAASAIAPWAVIAARARLSDSFSSASRCVGRQHLEAPRRRTAIRGGALGRGGVGGGFGASPAVGALAATAFACAPCSGLRASAAPWPLRLRRLRRIVIAPSRLGAPRPMTSAQ